MKKSIWSWEIMSDFHPHETPMCERLAEVEAEGWTVFAIVQTSYEGPGPFYKVFMRRETHLSGVYL